MARCREMATLPVGYIPQCKLPSASSSGSLDLIVCLFLTEEAQSHGGLRAREFGQGASMVNNLIFKNLILSVFVTVVNQYNL